MKIYKILTLLVIIFNIINLMNASDKTDIEEQSTKVVASKIHNNDPDNVSLSFKEH